MEENKYKYIIINVLNDEIVAKKSLRDISEFIKLIYPQESISHNTISVYFRKKNYFYFNELLIKQLVW